MAVHTELGCGMTEVTYEAVFASQLIKAGFDVRRQVKVPLKYEDEVVNKAFRVDLIVNEQIVVEIKVVKRIGLHHIKQTVTYLKVLRLGLGLILNFGAPSMRYGIKRVINTQGHKG
jgi:GxxExxY protein